MLKLNKHVYISTLTDLQDGSMLKIDVNPGDYKLTPFNGGYVFTKVDNFEELELVKVFCDQDGDKGLSGTYYSGESTDSNQLRIFKTWLWKRFGQYYNNKRCAYEESLIGYDYDSDDSEEAFSDLDEDGTDSKKDTNHLEERNKRLPKRDSKPFNFDPEPERKKMKLYLDDDSDNSYGQDSLELDSPTTHRPRDADHVIGFNEFHNLPFMFYLNKQVSNYDLIQLEELDPVADFFVWKVKEGEEHIGYVIEKELTIMMEVAAGIGIFERALAFGNFCTGSIYTAGKDSLVADARDGYKCFFGKDCDCNTSYKPKPAKLT